MSGTKALLKGINEAIKQRKWDEAIEAAEDVFQKDPKNYQAWEHPGWVGECSIINANVLSDTFSSPLPWTR